MSNALRILKGHEVQAIIALALTSYFGVKAGLNYPKHPYVWRLLLCLLSFAWLLGAAALGIRKHVADIEPAE